MTAVPVLPTTTDDVGPWNPRLSAVPEPPRDSPPVALLVLTEDGRLSTPRPDQLAALVAGLTRPSDGARPALDLGRLSLREDSYLATVDGERVPLTTREFDVLAELARAVGRVVTRHHLLRRVWGHENGSRRSVDVHVARLRAKLGVAAGQLVTVRGVGYRLDPA